MRDEARHGAHLSFTIRPISGGYELTVAPSAEGAEGLVAVIPEKSQVSFGEAVADLRTFKDVASEAAGDAWKAAGDALELLGIIGNEFLFKLLSRRDIERLESYLVVFFADRDAQDQPLLIDVNAPPEFQFPLEVMPLLGPPPEGMRSAGDVFAGAATFPGFAAIIRRNPLDLSVPRSVKLQADGRLPVRAFRHGRLEEDLLGPGGDLSLEVQAIWPEKEYEPLDARRRFGELVFGAPTLGTAGGEQVQHFACHCQTGSDRANRWEIQLAPPDGRAQIRLKYDELLAETRRYPADPAGARPLVFMNACGSAAIDPLSILSLPRMFLENGNCVYIGTETKIPPAVAAAMSRHFYRHLLEQASAGMALHRAKWELLTRGSPAGVLYTLYGDPDVAISPS